MKEEQKTESAACAAGSNSLQNALPTPSLQTCAGCIEMKKELDDVQQSMRTITYILTNICGTDLLSLPGINNRKSEQSTPECPVAMRPMQCNIQPSPIWNSLPHLPMNSQMPLFNVQDMLKTQQKSWPTSCPENGSKINANGDVPLVDPLRIERNESLMSAAKNMTLNPEVQPNIFNYLLAKCAPVGLTPFIYHNFLQQLNNQNDQRLQQPSALHLQHQKTQLPQQQQQSPIQSAPTMDKRLPPQAFPFDIYNTLKQNQQQQLTQLLNPALAAQSPLYQQPQAQPQLQPQQQVSQQLTRQQAPLQQQLQQHRQQLTLPVERKKAVSEDYVRHIRQKGVSDEDVAHIKIPVQLALNYDPDFKPASEEQIIQQFSQSRKSSEDVHKAMTFLSKMLAEKRVFGTKLMSETTVAGPNHSTYKNLPEDGIHYIAYVCRKVMMPRLPNDDDFWHVFGEVTRKLAARCRRVRHSNKVRNGENGASRENHGETPMECQ